MNVSAIATMGEGKSIRWSRDLQGVYSIVTLDLGNKDHKKEISSNTFDKTLSIQLCIGMAARLRKTAFVFTCKLLE